MLPNSGKFKSRPISKLQKSGGLAGDGAGLWLLCPHWHPYPDETWGQVRGSPHLSSLTHPWSA